MILKIDTTTSVPVYAQIVDQVKRAIAAGSLRDGDTLPSLRETALKLRINPLTVGKAYKLLEQEGLIETRHGLGSYVTSGDGAVADTYRHDVLCRDIDNMLVDAFHMGVTPNELKALFDERAEAASKNLADEAGSRRTDDDQ